jgi:hypothetical protein
MSHPLILQDMDLLKYSAELLSQNYSGPLRDRAAASVGKFASTGYTFFNAI